MDLEQVSTSWFDFLLDETYLEKYLQKDNQVPAPVDLISQFLFQAETATVALKEAREAAKKEAKEEEIENEEESGDTKKIKALRLLALKVAAHLKWDLEVLEDGLPMAMVYAVLVELLKYTATGQVNVCDAEAVDFSELALHDQFSVLLYHRWCIRIALKESHIVRPSKTPAIPVPGLLDPVSSAAQNKDMVIKIVSSTVEKSRQILQKFLDQSHDLFMPVIDSFGVLKEEEEEFENDWDKGISIPEDEMRCQVAYDLACAQFQLHQYEEAAKHFEEVDKFQKQKKNTKFCNICPTTLEGYMEACHSLGLVKRGSKNCAFDATVQALPKDLKKLNSILTKDNISRNLPAAYRESILEGVNPPSDKLELQKFNLAGTNNIHQILDGKMAHTRFIIQLKNGPAEYMSSFLKVCLDTLQDKNIPNYKKNHLKTFWKYLSLTMPHSFCKRLIKEVDAYEGKEKLLSTDVSISISSLKKLVCEDDLGMDHKLYLTEGDRAVNQGELERQLLTCYVANRISQLVDQLYNKRSKHGLAYLSSKWRIPKEFERAIENLSGTQKQVTMHILVAKAHLCLQSMNFQKARSLLQSCESSSKTSTYKLPKLLTWEALTVDLKEYEVCGATINQTDLCRRAKQCIVAARVDKDATPGNDLLMMCVSVLIQAKDWLYLTGLMNTNLGVAEFSRLLADVCQELPSIKNARKCAKDLWEAVLHIFTSGNPLKRNSSGAPLRDSSLGLLTQPQLITFISKVKEPSAVSILLSLLTKLYCNLKASDLTTEVSRDYDPLWPVALGNASALDVLGVTRAVAAIMNHALSLDPSNISWLKTTADFYYAHGCFAKALRYYLETGAVPTSFFTDPYEKNFFDDSVIDKMIKCCNNLSCYTQVAVLCQFKENKDYSLAFKALQERNSDDSVDCYYDFFWDVTILEYLVNLHTKHGEHDKYQIALRAITQLELNSSNPTEILKEAAKLRYSRFLAALAKQYMIKDS